MYLRMFAVCAILALLFVPPFRAADSLPAVSVCFAVTDLVPLVSVDETIVTVLLAQVPVPLEDPST